MAQHYTSCDPIDLNSSPNRQDEADKSRDEELYLFLHWPRRRPALEDIMTTLDLYARPSKSRALGRFSRICVNNPQVMTCMSNDPCHSHTSHLFLVRAPVKSW